VGTAAGDVVRHVTIDRREQRVVIDSVTSSPTMVAFDDENAIVKSLAFDQPTPWLATLLDRHPDLWQRAWAIEQLGRRTGDTLARAALARAATRADYDLTRAEAARALGGFAPAEDVSALATAVHDTSAQVRNAALPALAAVDGERAVAAAGDAWRGDASDQVRATALLVLVRRGGPLAREAVLKGLGTPSYRDAIQNAAVAAVVQRPDPGLVAALVGQLCNQPVPAMGLAGLVTRGDTAARTAMQAALDDGRVWVREWMLAALDDQFEPADALALLRQVEPMLRRPEARAEVTRTIDRLGRPPH
jgi:HEAT repeat protein